jgi:hypothetical protein
MISILTIVVKAFWEGKNIYSYKLIIKLKINFSINNVLNKIIKKKDEYNKKRTNSTIITTITNYENINEYDKHLINVIYTLI